MSYETQVTVFGESFHVEYRFRGQYHAATATDPEELIEMQILKVSLIGEPNPDNEYSEEWLTDPDFIASVEHKVWDQLIGCDYY